MSYAKTATLSVDAPQLRVNAFSPMLLQLGAPGVVGAWVSAAAPTVSLSTFGPPLEVVAVARILLVPLIRSPLTDNVCQVSQVPVPGNVRLAITVPLTAMSIGRAVVVPLANRKVSPTVAAAVAGTVHST